MPPIAQVVDLEPAFDPPVPAPVRTVPHFWRWFHFLLACGIVGRLAVAFYGQGIWASDEHEQYLEQAFRHIHGYGTTFWEQARGLRHPSFHHILAGLLTCLESLGIDDPFLQARLIRMALALAIYAGMVLFALTLYRRGQPVACLFLMFLFAFMLDVVYLNTRTLTDNAIILPMCLAVVLWDRRPGWAGLCLGLMFGLRPQSILFSAGFWQVAVFRDWRARCKGRSLMATFARSAALSAGLVAGMIIMGYWDYLEYGGWFHSTLENIRANLIENGGTFCGTKPLGYYVWVVGTRFAMSSVFAIPLLCYGLRRAPALLYIAAFGWLMHAVIPHKEGRFLWGIYPLLCLFMALGMESLWASRERRRLLLRWVVASFLIGNCLRAPFLPWKNEPFMPTAKLLNKLHNREDLHGVAILVCHGFDSGNQFYLRRPVPLLYAGDEVPDLLEMPQYKDGTIDALIMPRSVLDEGPAIPFRQVDHWRHWVLLVRER